LLVALITTRATLAFIEREAAEQKKMIQELRRMNDQCHQLIKQHGYAGLNVSIASAI
jgi:hypothetical protein